MRKSVAGSFLAKVMRKLKRIALFWVKVVYLSPFFILGAWLISVVYFPGFDLNASISLLKPQKKKVIVQPLVQKKEAIPRNHFHITDAYVEREETLQSICATCHGRYAHGKEKTIRALLNMHEGFIDCSVCHVRRDRREEMGKTLSKDEEIEYLWVDRDDGQFKHAVQGEYGKYPAKIFAVINSESLPRRIYSPMTEAAAGHFLKVEDALPPQQRDEARATLHRAISKEPVTCSNCHKKDGYMNFEQLGFPKQRVDHLVSSEIVGMIDKYKTKTFYLPSVIDFGGQ